MIHIKYIYAEYYNIETNAYCIKMICLRVEL